MEIKNALARISQRYVCENMEAISSKEYDESNTKLRMVAAYALRMKGIDCKSIKGMKSERIDMRLSLT